jgi:uncharacterized protein YcbK (DUF882 family)
MGLISDNFKREEFACRCGCGFDTVDAMLLEYLEAIRLHFGKPVTITSGCRCPFHNNLVGGSDRSQHTLGRAADIIVKDVDPAKVQSYAESIGCAGVGSAKNFTHIDSRSKHGARWRY